MIFKSTVKGNTNSITWRPQRLARVSLFFDLFPAGERQAAALIREIQLVKAIFEEMDT